MNELFTIPDTKPDPLTAARSRCERAYIALKEILK
jgi:hypothetical protein